VLFRSQEEEQARYSDAKASIDFVPAEIDIDEVVELALSNRPDIEITRLSAKAHGYDELVQRRKNWPKITLSGFGGRSASYYTTESENFKNDWNIGIKFSMGLGPNTVSSIYTKEDTSPKLGQDTRTSSDMYSLKMGLFDNLNSFTKISEAKVGRLKAEEELDQMEREVMMEAKQAFFDYQGSILRIKNSKEKLEYLNQMFIDTNLRVKMGKLPVSQLMDARMKLADQKGLYVQALSDGFIALAKLDKVTGRPGYYTKMVISEEEARQTKMEEMLKQEDKKEKAIE
jgi:outer membrane protein TolC